MPSLIAALATPDRRLWRLPRREGFWAVAFSFFAVTVLSTTPSGLYSLYEQREGLTSITITIVYAVYGAGTVASLLLVGHVSDWYGRRPVLVSGVLTAILSAVVFITLKSLPGLLVARLLSGIALGATVATGTAYLLDLDLDSAGLPSRRSGIVATLANIGGLAVGPLLAGLLARYEPDGLTLPYEVVLAALVLAAVAALSAPEGHPRVGPRPRYRPQHLRLPDKARPQFVAAVSGAFLSFAAFGMFAGLAGTFLAGPLHHPSSALAGFTIFVNFGSGVVMQTTTTRWPLRRLLSIGILLTTTGLIVVVVSTWISPPSLALFIIGGAVVGAGCGGIFRGGLTLVISTADANDLAGALATFFVAGYAGLCVPVIGLGIALQHLTPRVTLLLFGVLVGLGTVAAAPVLLGRPAHRSLRHSDDPARSA